MTIANHSEPKLKLDLQFFSEEDAILPDDYEAEPQAEESTDDGFGDEQETAQPNEEDQPEEQPKDDEPTEEEKKMFKVKFNHEEQEIPYDDAVPLIQKGMNYDKLQERYLELESDPRLSFLDELAQEQGMDVNEYLSAVREQREQSRIDELIQNNVPEEYAREMVESQKFRKELEAQKKEQEQQQKIDSDFKDFFQYFKNANDRDFVPNKDEIPQEVWDATAQGTPLKYAYMEHHNKQLQNKLKAMNQNEENKKKAPVGSVTTHGGDSPTSEDPFLQGFNSI